MVNITIFWSFRTKNIYIIILRIEANLAYAGLNSAHVGFYGLNKPTIKTAASYSYPKPTSRCQSFLLI